MKIILSPAKLMDTKSTLDLTQRTTPIFLDQTLKLQHKYQQLSPKKIQALMNISDKLAQENWERNQNWKPKPEKEQSIQAFLAFKGEVFRGLHAETIHKENYPYLQNNLKILSGLYGILHPFDAIMPYRMEMGISFPYGKNKNLYEFWTHTITSFLNSTMEKNEEILNLASNEYQKVIDRKVLKNTIIDVEFKENRNGKLQSIMTFFKNARGKMARYCINNEIDSSEKVKLFDVDGYQFSAELSSHTKYVFIR